MSSVAEGPGQIFVRKEHVCGGGILHGVRQESRVKHGLVVTVRVYLAAPAGVGCNVPGYQREDGRSPLGSGSSSSG